MEKKSNGKLLALAAVGAFLMCSLFFGVSFLTKYDLPAANISSIKTPLSSFAGWIGLICFASLTIMGLGKMSSRISAKWFLTFPLSILGIVAVMFLLIWVAPSGFFRLPSTQTWNRGRTALIDGTTIRTTAELKAYLEKPVLSPNVPLAPPNFDFLAAKSLWTEKCNRCHTQDSTMDALKTKYKKTGKIDVIVTRMYSQAGSGISPEEGKTIMMWLNEGLGKY